MVELVELVDEVLELPDGWYGAELEEMLEMLLINCFPYYAYLPSCRPDCNGLKENRPGFWQTVQLGYLQLIEYLLGANSGRIRKIKMSAAVK